MPFCVSGDCTDPLQQSVEDKGPLADCALEKGLPGRQPCLGSVHSCTGGPSTAACGRSSERFQLKLKMLDGNTKLEAEMGMKNSRPRINLLPVLGEIMMLHLFLTMSPYGTGLVGCEHIFMFCVLLACEQKHEQRYA